MDVRIGAYQADAWTGLVLSPGPGRGFAFRFAAETAAGTVDLDDFFWLIHEVGPHAPDGSYARVAFDLALPLGRSAETPVLARADRDPGLTLEWSRTGEAGVAGRVRCGFEGRVVVRPYIPWDWSGAWTAVGEGAWTAADDGASTAAGLIVAVHRTGRPARADFDGRAAQSASPGTRPQTDEADSSDQDGLEPADLAIPVDPDTEIRFAAALADTPSAALECAHRVARAGIRDRLDHSARDWEARRPRVSGPFSGLAASMSDNLNWMVLLQPESGARYTPAGRRWIFPRSPDRGGGKDHWTVFGWDSFFNALELDVDAPDLARETLLAGLRTAGPDGCVPNWKGRFGGSPDRSQPPIAGLAALKLHLRRPDPGFLEEVYPRLAAWSRWWVAERNGVPRRSPGPHGLLTWGSDRDRVDPSCPPWEKDADTRTLAGWESGQDDLPTWDEAEPVPELGCLALDPVDLNAYRVLDLECLAHIAREIGRVDEAVAHDREADALRDRVNEVLWDNERETYADRRWDGAFTTCRTASHFLVLVAGIATPDRARRMVDHLTDPDLFWGDRVVPTISRDDPRFVQQQYWRGTIWPPINYLIRLGLTRYGFDSVSGSVASRGALMFLEDWRRTGLCRENFDSRTGTGSGQRHQSWGPLFALAALEEMIDVTPWTGLRIGGRFTDGETRLEKIDMGGRRFDLSIGPSSLRFGIDGRPVLTSHGAAVLRNVVIEPARFAAEVSARETAELELHLAGERWSARIGGVVEETGRRLSLGAGSHRIEWVLIG